MKLSVQHDRRLDTVKNRIEEPFTSTLPHYDKRLARLSCVPDPALATSKSNLMAHTLPAITAELVSIDCAVCTEDAALVEFISLLNLNLAFGGTGILRVSNPTIAAKLVANRDLASVRVAEALVLGCAVAAELGAFVELVALV
jgi:hypothetical protein